MIRKIIYTIGFLMFLSGPLAPLMIHAQTNPASVPSTDIACQGERIGILCKASHRVEYALQGKTDAGLDWGSTFGGNDPAKVGQNLYLTVYNKSQSNTLSQAIKETAAQYGMPPERMELVLGGDMAPILERNPLMRIDDAVNLYNQMVAAYQDRKNSADLQASITAKVEPNEMFADGDLSNSGFDLINDLNNIEIILFKKNDLVSFGGTYNADSSNSTNNNSSASNGSPAQAGGTPANGIGGVNGAASSSNGSGNKPAVKQPPLASPFNNVREDKSSSLLGGINPNQCFTDSKVDDALDNFSIEAANNKKMQHTFSNTGTSASSDSGSGNGTNANAGGINIPVPNTSGSGTTAPASTPTVAPAAAGNYSSPSLCPNGDIYCITIDFIKTPAVATFSSSDNCIACHVQFINESLKKTISHSLIPAKAAGNYGESSMCKVAAGTALGSVGMNISIQTVPIITPSKNDLVTLGNVSDEWKKYADQNGAWNYGEKERRRLEALKTGQPVDTSPIPSSLEREILVTINNSADNTSQANVLTRASASDAANKAAETQTNLITEIAKDAQSQVNTYKALDDEMKSMNQYFEDFQKNMRSLLEDVPGMPSSKACVKLNALKVCT